MQTTKLSSKGQVIIPKIIRSRYNWNSGQKLSVIDTGDGILLRPSRSFKSVLPASLPKTEKVDITPQADA